MTGPPYLTPQERRRRQAAARTIPLPRLDAVELMDQITGAWPDPSSRPPGAAAAHDTAAAKLVAEKENP